MAERQGEGGFEWTKSKWVKASLAVAAGILTIGVVVAAL